MTRCVFCGRRLWPWQRIGWFATLVGRRAWHPACLRLATSGVEWLTIAEIQRLLDEAQA